MVWSITGTPELAELVLALQGCGLVEFKSSEAAKKALKTLNNLDFWEGARYPLLVERMLPSSCKPPKQSKVAAQTPTGPSSAKASPAARGSNGRQLPNMNGSPVWQKQGMAGELQGNWGGMQGPNSQLWNSAAQLQRSRLMCPSMGSLLGAPGLMPPSGAGNGLSARNQLLMNSDLGCLSGGAGGMFNDMGPGAADLLEASRQLGITPDRLMLELNGLNRSESTSIGMSADPTMPELFGNQAGMLEPEQGLSGDWASDMSSQMGPLMAAQVGV